MVFKFRESSHTWWPFLNGINDDFHLSAMRFLASSCAASASSQFRWSVFILSSMVVYFVVSNASGIAIGDSPNMSSNGVCVLSACLRLLCVNSSVCKAWGHSSGCEAQYIDRYASIS